MKDPEPTFAYFVRRLKEAHPDLAYIHVVESREDDMPDENAGEVRICRKLWMCSADTFSFSLHSRMTSSAKFGHLARSSVPVATVLRQP